MKREYITISQSPAIVFGEQSEKVFLFVHGQHGNKEEAEAFAQKVSGKGWQVVSIDLPEHGERKKEQGFVPWVVVPELQEVWQYIESRWHQIRLRANSIGAWFSMLALSDKSIEQSLFVSPLVDMEQLILTMMSWAGVSEDHLEEEGIIQTDFGQELSWAYLLYTRQYPVKSWKSPTSILYGGKDNLTERHIVEKFSSAFDCKLTVMEEGEHWFHTDEQLDYLNKWLEADLTLRD